MRLTLDSVCKSYGANHVLQDVSLNLTRSEVIGLLGRNGAGKTTLLKIIAGIISPDSGEIRLGNSMSPADLSYRQKVSYLSEKNPLYPRFYVKEYLQWIAGMYRLSNPDVKVKKIIEQLNLEEVSNQKIGHLSKGFKQRIGLASAIIPDPDILVLDEPVNGLDPSQILHYRNIIRDLSQTKKIILSSHLMQEIDELSDRIVLIDKGIIKMDGTLRVVKESLKGQKFRIELNKNIALDLLSKESWISVVTKKSERVFEVSSEKSHDIGSQLFDWAVRNDLKLLELHRTGDELNALFED